jgi:hypothetical protein
MAPSGDLFSDSQSARLKRAKSCRNLQQVSGPVCSISGIGVRKTHTAGSVAPSRRRRMTSEWGSRGGMAFGAGSRHGFGAGRQRFWSSAPQAVFGGALVAGAALLSSWVLCGIFAGPRSGQALALAREETAAPRTDPATARFAARFYLGAGTFSTVVPDQAQNLDAPSLQAAVPAVRVVPSASRSRRMARIAPPPPPRSLASRVRQNPRPLV